jgi:signal transduction histidine kinase
MSAVDLTRRWTRNVVGLVIVAVALPSLLLTGMGVIAVQNEQSASKRRLEHAYKPVLNGVATEFNATIDGLLEESGAPLAALVSWTETGDVHAGAEARGFARAHAYATNFFVIDEDGERLRPEAPDEDGPTLPVDPELAEAVRAFAPAAGDATPRLDAGALAIHGRTLARLLSDPTVRLAGTSVTAVAKAAAARLSEQHRPEVDDARITLETIAARDELFAFLAKLSRPRDFGAVVTSYPVNDWRRVVLVRDVGGRLVGFELVATGFAGILERGLGDAETRAGVEAAVFPVLPPAFWGPGTNDQKMAELEDKILAWALLKKTDLAWELALSSRGDDSLLSLGHSRARLYFWTLVLIVTALVAGIVLTLRAVAREARLSRLKTDFVSSVSHDLRTPLTSIRMFTETLLLGRVSSKAEERECLETIAAETERLSRLTERILDFSRMEAGRKPYNFTQAETGDLVRQSLVALKPLIDESGFDVTVKAEAGLPPVSVDRDAMVEALINLLANAIKYSPEDKRVTVSIAREATGNGHAGVAIAVADHGIGIAKHEQARIFDMFYRVDCRRTTEVDGSGIGLSLVQHIVHAHHGRVTVDSTPGRGSIFTIHLPAVSGSVT